MAFSTLAVAPSFSRPDAQNGVCQCRRHDAALSDCTEGILLFDLLTDPVIFRVSKPAMLFFFSPGYHSKRHSRMNSD